ncbi:ricin-type beta-trefoil lectin domain protein [Streptomyces sp. NPDC017943]|uniref:ricin-type beta-trefoil lectin domain protein n=1 Tax=Streptomyces sp. NPDC017943 TaxID=3365019 RepID=UPI0037ADCDC6
MKDAGPSNSPGPARRYGPTDEQLSAELRKWTGATPALHPVGELLDRHWEAAFAYARLCTDGTRPAGMLTTAAFTRLFGETLRQNGPTSAWRPHLLVTVRRIAAEWCDDHRREMLHPALLTGDADGLRPAARLLPVAHRRLLAGAFQRLPQSARCLLWHIEVEREPLASPAGLLGLDEEGARVELGRARDRLREECLQLHRELAPDEECRRYLRLLDVTYRRGGRTIDPDLRAHIEGCRHCSAAADQLDRFNHGLGTALSEAVLGWGGAEYASSRTGSAAEPGPSTASSAAASAVSAPHPAPDGFPSPPAVGADGPAEHRPGLAAEGRDAFGGGTAPVGFEESAHAAHGTAASGFGTRTAAGRAAASPAPGSPGEAGPGGAAPRLGSHGEGGHDAAAHGPEGGDGIGFRTPPPVPRSAPDPVALAQAAFPDPVAPVDPVALAGATGESFTDPGGPAPAPVPPRPGPSARAAATAGPGPDGPDASPSSPATPPPPDAPAPGPRAVGPRTAARRAGRKAARRAARRRNLTAGVLTAGGLVVLPLVLWTVGGSGDSAPQGGKRPAGEAPDVEEPTTAPSWVGAGEAGKDTLRGRLRNADSGLCVGLDGGKAVEGAEAVLTDCDSAPGRQWTYETDGLLRSGADPGLCLDSGLGYSVRLTPCAGPSGADTEDVRYDFTLQGALVPRSDQDLALTPSATDGSGALVLKARADDAVQRWVIDTAKADLRMKAVTWNEPASARPPAPVAVSTPPAGPASAPTPSDVTPRTSPAPQEPTEAPCHRYGYCDEDGRYEQPGPGYPDHGYPEGGYGGHGHDRDGRR